MKYKFATSYFAMLRYLPKNYIPISICIWDPKWYPGENHKYGMENKDIPKGLIPQKYNSETDCESCSVYLEKRIPTEKDLNCSYLTNYRQQLNHFNVQRTTEYLIKCAEKYIQKYRTDLINKNEIVLCFVGYEESSRICSERFILAEWFTNDPWFIENYGNIEEFKRN